MAIALDDLTRSHMETALAGLGCTLSVAADATEALTRLRTQEYALIILAYPLPHLLLRFFLQQLRHPASASRKGSVMVLAIPELLSGALRFVGNGANAVLPRWASRSQLVLTISKLLEVPPRYPPSPGLEVRIQKPDGSAISALGVVNLSVSGVLLRSAEQPMLGSTVRTVLSHPGLPHPLELPARVVRHTKPERESVEGFALNFDGPSLDPALPVLTQSQ